MHNNGKKGTTEKKCWKGKVEKTWRFVRRHGSNFSPNDNTLVLKTSFHGDERVLGSCINMRRFITGVSNWFVIVDVLFPIDWVMLIGINSNQDHTYISLMEVEKNEIILKMRWYSESQAKKKSRLKLTKSFNTWDTTFRQIKSHPRNTNWSTIVI